MARHASLQRADQAIVHVLEFIGDIEADDALAAQLRTESVAELEALATFHDEDQVCPREQFRRDRNARIAANAG
jgi:hypothetical protein